MERPAQAGRPTAPSHRRTRPLHDRSAHKRRPEARRWIRAQCARLASTSSSRSKFSSIPPSSPEATIASHAAGARRARAALAHAPHARRRPRPGQPQCRSVSRRAVMSSSASAWLPLESRSPCRSGSVRQDRSLHKGCARDQTRHLQVPGQGPRDRPTHLSRDTPHQNLDPRPRRLTERHWGQPPPALLRIDGSVQECCVTPTRNRHSPRERGAARGAARGARRARGLSPRAARYAGTAAAPSSRGRCRATGAPRGSAAPTPRPRRRPRPRASARSRA